MTGNPLPHTYTHRGHGGVLMLGTTILLRLIVMLTVMLRLVRTHSLIICVFCIVAAIPVAAAGDGEEGGDLRGKQNEGTRQE